MNAGFLIVGLLLLIVSLGFVVDFRGYGTRLLAFARDFGRTRPMQRPQMVSEGTQRLWFGLSIGVIGVIAVLWGLSGG